MKCPSCKSELIVSGQARLETVCEHVSNPNGIPSLKDKYICSDIDCETHNYGVCWNSGGEKYSEYPDNSIYADNNDAPFGSFQRKLNIEIYKDDENISWNFGKYCLELD